MKRESSLESFPVSSFTLPDYLFALLAGLCAFALYLRTLAPGLLSGDSAEFQMASWLGGFVHPTGYPLYLLLGFIWTHLLPAGDPAWRMNLLSAVWAAIAVGLVYLLAFRLVALCWPPGERPRLLAARLAGLFAALAFAVTPTFWGQAVIAEVYTLNAAFIVAVLLGLTAWAAQPRDSQSLTPLYWTAALYGLSLTHHRSMLLLLPAIAVYLWLVPRAKFGPGGGMGLTVPAIARILALVVLPLLIYLVIPLRAPHAPYAALRIGPHQILQLYDPTPGGFIKHISGQVFGSSLGVPVDLANRLESGARLFISEVPVGCLGLGLIGLLGLAWRSRPLLALTGLVFLAVVTFNLLYAIGDIFVYYIPAYLIWILWAALGVAALSTLLSRIVAQRGSSTRTAVLLLPCLLALLLPIGAMARHYASLDRSADNQARATWQAILKQAIPADAILVSNDRDEMVPMWYLQYVEGSRPDLTGLFPLIQPTPDWSDVGRVVLTALGTGRAVLLIKPMPGLETRFQIAPAGSLVRVTGPAAQNPPQIRTDVDFAGAVRLTGYDLSPAQLQAGDETEVTLYWKPLQQLNEDYTTFVHLVNADGVVIGASDHRPGGVYYPTSLWRTGDVLRDAHTITLTHSLGRPPYAIEAGLYSAEPALQHLGQPERLELPIHTQPQG